MAASVASGRLNIAKKYFVAFACSWSAESVVASLASIRATESRAPCRWALVELARLKSTAQPTPATIGIAARANVMATLPRMSVLRLRARLRQSLTNPAIPIEEVLRLWVVLSLLQY